MNSLLPEVIKLWNKAEPEIPFDRMFTDCLYNGSIIIRPDRIILGKECWSDGKKIYHNYRRINCWFIYAASQVKGMELYNFRRDAYTQHEFIAFHRRGKLKIYKWDKLEGRL